MSKKSRVRESRAASFRSQVVSLGTPMLRRFADGVEASLEGVINQAVRDFFSLRHHGGGDRSMDVVSGEDRASSSDDGGSASPSEPVGEHGGTAVREPEGFRRLGCVANAGWFNMRKAGNVLQGTLEGMYDRKDDLRPEKKSSFFQIKLMQPCEVRMGTGEEARLVEAKEGDYVNLNYGQHTNLLEPFIPLIARGAEFGVWGKVLGEKIKLPGGRARHDFELFAKPIKAPFSDDDEPTFLDGST